MELTQLKKVVCINLDFHLWSARRKLRLDDLKIIDGEVPPEDLASLGSKKICNPEDIADFDTLKKEAERICFRAGVKFLGGFAVPEEKAADLGLKLDDIVSRFYAKKSVFLADYDANIQQWIDAHPGWEKIIRDAALDRDEVGSKISAGWQAYKIVEADDLDANQSTLNKGLATAAKGLAGQLYFEIARAAADVMEKSLLSRDKVTQKILSPIRTIRDKLEGLSFIDKRVRPLVETIDHVMGQLPDAGHIDGLGLAALHGLVFILSSEDRMQKHGEMVLAGQPVADAFNLSVPRKAVTQTVPTAPQIQQSVLGAPVVPARAANIFDIKSTGAIPTIPSVPLPVVRGVQTQNLFSF